MSTIGKNIKSRRKKNSPSDRQLAVDFTGSIQFMHEASGGETEINLQELVLPSGSGSFINPTPEEIRGINLAALRDRIRLFNGEGKKIPLGLHFDVLGTKIILKGLTAGVGEIFFGSINNVPRQNIAFLDGRQHQTTGFLEPGETQFNLGFSVRLSDVNTSVDRLGPLEVHRQREIQYLNTDHVTANISADGDYAFVDDGFGNSSVIEFNAPGAVLLGGLPEFISIKSNTISVDKEDGSLRQEMDVLGGAVDRIADEVSIIHSIPKSDLLNFNATRQQLRQFGDQVLANTRLLVEATASQLGLLKKNRIQTKFLTSNFTGTGELTDLRFNNLVSDRWYEAVYQLRVVEEDLLNTYDRFDLEVVIENGAGDNLALMAENLFDSGNPITDYRWTNYIKLKFQATDSILKIRVFKNTNMEIIGNNTRTRTFVQLEERNDLVSTTAF